MVNRKIWSQKIHVKILAMPFIGLVTVQIISCLSKDKEITT